MSRRVLILGGAFAAALAVTVPAAAAPRTHDGFQLRLEPGLGPVGVTESFGNVESELSGMGSSFHLQLGGTPARGFVVGGSMFGSTVADPTAKSGNLEVKADGTMMLAGLGAYGSYYFDPTAGGHVQLFLGFAALDYVRADGQSGGNDPTGTVFGVSGGYEFWVSDEWSIGPVVRLTFGSLSSESGGATIDYSYFQPALAAAITYH